MIFANRLFAWIMIVIAGGFFIAAGAYPQDAANWPKVFAVVMVLFSSGLIYDTYKTPEREAGATSPLLILREKAGMLALIVGISLVYLGCLENVGFILLTPVFAGSLIWLLGYRSWRKTVMIAAIITLTVWLSFELLLQIPLPEGIFDDFFRTLRGGLF